MVSNYVINGSKFHIVATVLINDSTKVLPGAVGGDVRTNTSNFDVEDFLVESFGERRKDLASVITLTIVYSVIFLTGVIGNMSTCIVITKNSYLHSATNYYLFSLAVSDMLTLLLGLPPELYSIWEAYPWRFGEVFCIFKSFLSEMTSYASVLTITAFTVERYVAICHPIKAQTLSNLSRAIRIIVIIWIVACASAMPYPIHTRVFYYLKYPNTTKPIEDSKQCNIPLAWIDFMKHMFQVSFFVFFVLPMGIISIMYILIGITLKKSQFGGSAEAGFKNSAKATARKAVIKMLVAVVVAFFVCWAPFHSQRLMTSYLSRNQWTLELLDFQSHLFYISGVLYFFNSTVNPLLYNMMSRKFRRAFKRTLCRCCFSREELAELKGTSRSVLYSERTQCVSRFKDSSPIHLKGINGSIRRTKSGNILTPGPSPRAVRLLLNGYTQDRRPQSMVQNGRRVVSSVAGPPPLSPSIPPSPNISPAASVGSFDGVEMECRKLDEDSRSVSRSGSSSVALLVRCTNVKQRDTTFV
ncbi:pyrokinin-1 receptor-like [Haliotis rubra]|uniref:pyrokinin-1 receptor-like n=1 Tax=Haliotis rubra TaxID=36100 RepID=UPI001EE59AE3|nr:pyrokinin-1 receptor-like [Haliotis rubra]